MAGLNESMEDVVMGSADEDDEDALILEADDAVNFDFEDSGDENSSSVPIPTTARVTSTVVSQSTTYSDKTLIDEEDALLNESLSDNESLVGTAEEIDCLLESSPKKTTKPQLATRKSKKSLPVTDPSSCSKWDKPIKILVPIMTAGDCVQIKFDEESRNRIYCNEYYERSIEMTQDKTLWEKIEKDDFGDEDERPDVFEYTLPSTDEMICLYQSLNLYENKLVAPTLNNVNRRFRLDSVLLRGVSGMSTNDVFLYLRTYQQIPVKLEWVNDIQCIAIFANEREAARCLINLSKPIVEPDVVEPPPSPKDIDTKFDLVDEVPKNWVQLPMPPSHVWRFTVASFHDAKSKPGFLLTIPHRSDKKQSHAESLSDYYREHGNPNWNETPSIWTKSGYDAKMRKKRRVIALKNAPVGREEPSVCDLDNDEVEVPTDRPVRVPISARLGIPNKRKWDEDDDPVEREEEDDGEERPAKVSRLVSLVTRQDGPVDRRRRGSASWADSEDKTHHWSNQKSGPQGNGYQGNRGNSRWGANEEELAPIPRQPRFQWREDYGDNEGGQGRRRRRRGGYGGGGGGGNGGGSIQDRLGW